MKGFVRRLPVIETDGSSVPGSNKPGHLAPQPSTVQYRKNPLNPPSGIELHAIAIQNKTP